MAKPDPNIAAHLEWIGFVRPTGLVVSAPALDRAGAVLDRRDVEGQRLLRECADERCFASMDEPQPWLPDFRAFAAAVLGWSFSPIGYAGTDDVPIPAELEATASNSGGILRPDLAVRTEPLRGAADAPPWQLLVQICEPGEDFDRVARAGDGLEASPHGRMERLLRHTGVPAGLLFNGLTLRLVSAPRGESSGWLDFRVADMVQTAGRPISTAMRLLLHERRLLSLPRTQRLASLLEDSRKYQNEVSERLAQQVLHALYELLRGFQAAHDLSGRKLLKQPLDDSPDDVYRGLLTLVLRLVFLLYAEERDMLPQDATFLRAYSLAALHARLREDAALRPDTMDQRYGAYAQLLVLFRMVHDGARSGAMALPPRHGALFDPDRYRFLESRGAGGARQIHERVEPPWVPDGTIYRVLEKLLVLDGERISYRALDVEHIGSVYETMMGFRLETATGRSAAIRAAKKHGAPATVDIEALLREAPGGRAKWIQDRTDRKLTERVKQTVRDADTVEALHAALDPVIDREATPDLVPAGAMVLQPSEERRRSGSHYTPRELTEPIVRTALEPIFRRLWDGESSAPNREGATVGEKARPPRPERILDLRVCDPAMGSGAFLVETCRQLADALIEAWRAHDAVPEIPADENEIVYARRQVAQRCLYGVDRNPVAVDLAKLSLWLITLAKDHPLTFLDHALRHGDSLVGLSRRQIEAFHWKGDAPQFQAGFEVMRIREHLANIAALRERIREAGEEVSDQERRLWWRDAREELAEAGAFGDLVLAAFFEKAKAKEREALRTQLADAVVRGETHRYRSWLAELRNAEPPLAPFHWEIEFPEIFERDNPGFDAIVGNPPFAGKNTVAAANVAGYPDWLKQVHAGSHGNADQVAHFFRRAFDLVRRHGAFGLIATNTIAQGDTRSTGLRWICTHGGEIYRARRRVPWPGLAAVVVSVLHVHKGPFTGVRGLDDAGPCREPRQRRSGGALLPSRLRSGPPARRLRPDRHQHHRPGRHTLHRTTVDLHARRRDLSGAAPGPVARTRSGGGQRAARPQGSVHRRARPRRRRDGSDHRVSLSPGWARRPGAAGGECREELPGQHRARHGLHLRRHGQEGGRHAARRDAAADRRESADSEDGLSLHRWRGGEYEPDTRAPPVRHQLPRLAVATGGPGRALGGGGRRSTPRLAPQRNRAAGLSRPGGRGLAEAAGDRRGKGEAGADEGEGSWSKDGVVAFHSAPPRAACRHRRPGSGAGNPSDVQRSGTGLPAGRDGVQSHAHRFSVGSVCCVRLAPISLPPDVVGVLGADDEGRPPLYAVRLLRDLSFPRSLGVPSRSRSRRQDVLRFPRDAHGSERRGSDQDLQPLPRPPRKRS